MLQPERVKTNILTIANKKLEGIKISAATAYDFPSAMLVNEAGIDIILVGDSLGMVIQGHDNTLRVSMDEMVYHTSLVSRARPLSLVVADMPYASFHLNGEQAAANAIRLVKEGGAEAVKLEGGRKRKEVIKAILAAEIPVMGHVGLTPQSLHALGGFRVQGKFRDKAREIFDDAHFLQECGAFAIVLESMPLELAQKISASLTIPTIGIGAGPHCDGQVLVFHDLLGITNLYMPKFVRQYASLRTTIQGALSQYKSDIEAGSFPADAESYHLGEDIEKLLS